MEKFTIRNEDEFQRLAKLVDSIKLLKDTDNEVGGRRRYPIDVYMGDIKVSAFLYGNKTVYRKNAITDSTGKACINEEVGHNIYLAKRRADKGDLSGIGKENDGSCQ